ncbi:MAG: DUF6754 domain-containing protein [candidate division Zixibacteria bacterium]|nr:DUF6754 domain-containing protein [candidate division Zixibacteria bacterium]
MRNKLLLILCLLLVLGGAPTWAQEIDPLDTTAAVDSVALSSPAPVSMVQAKDKGNDHGHAVVISWELSADDSYGDKSVIQYEVFLWKPFLYDTIQTLRDRVGTAKAHLIAHDDDSRDWKKEFRRAQKEFDEIMKGLTEAHAAYPEGGEFVNVGKVPCGENSFKHIGSKGNESGTYLPDYTDFYYRVDAVTANSEIRSQSEIIGPVQCYGQWFNTGRNPVLAAVLIFGFLTLFFVKRARKGSKLYVRPIGGIEAVDDAIGRATEMGRPILYVMGLGTAADVATIASFTILGRVAKQVAEYQTQLIVPTYDPIVMSVGQEVVKSSYMDAGRADAYDKDIVFFVTQSQFAYVAAVNGIMLRDRPATCIYMGKFFAESLLLAETGSMAGSIQISGTDEVAQIPFFIVACDYTLIGEELYAASAYLGREPVLLGSLKAQDYAKAILLIFAVLGLVAANLDFNVFTELFHVTN